MWVGGVLLLALAGGAAWYIAKNPTQPENNFRRGRGGPFDLPTPVRVMPVRQDDIDVDLKALGTVTPLNTVTVRPRLDGELTKVLFTEGQRVQEGQVLAEIDPRPYQVALAQAEGQKAENEARLKNALADLASYKKLHDEQLIMRQQLTTQESLVAQIQGALQANDAQVNNARLQLSYTKIIAPITGRLGLRQVDAGNLVRSGDANGIVVITQMHPISAIFTVPEADLPSVLTALKAGAKPEVEAWDRAESVKLATGVLQTVDNQIDTATGTIRLRATFVNQDEKLFPNQFVNMRLRVSTLAKATVIPSATVQRASFGPFVYVVQNDETVTIRRITLGPVEGENVAVTSGLTPGEKVVLEGVDELSEGARIEIVPEGGAPARQMGPGQGGPGGRGGRNARGGQGGQGGPGGTGGRRGGPGGGGSRP
jgi:membrane fusion protein, multidrug efflux system